MVRASVPTGPRAGDVKWDVGWIWGWISGSGQEYNKKSDYGIETFILNIIWIWSKNMVNNFNHLVSCKMLAIVFDSVNTLDVIYKCNCRFYNCITVSVTNFSGNWF